MFPPIVTAVGQARLDDLYRQARRDALLRAARQARRAARQQSGHPRPGILAAVSALARRPTPAPESS
jgi:hypothetical protein